MKDYAKQIEESLNKLSPEKLQKLDDDIHNSYGESVSVDEYLAMIKISKSTIKKMKKFIVKHKTNGSTIGTFGTKKRHQSLS